MNWELQTFRSFQKIPQVEGLAESLRKRRLRQGRDPRQASEPAHLSEFADRGFSRVFLRADEGHALDWDVSSPQRFEREQRVIDRAERRPCAEDDGQVPRGEEVDLQ